MNEMVALIARMEQATEGSRELDFRIQCVVAPSDDLPMGHTSETLLAKAEKIGDWSGAGRLSDCPRYTISLNAALKLIPEGWFLSNLSRRTQPEMGGRMWNVELFGYKHIHSKGQRTACLALVVASLKARETAG